MPKDINVNTAVLKLLPALLSIGYLVTRLLIQLQNSYVDPATQITKEKQWYISNHPSGANQDLSRAACVTDCKCNEVRSKLLSLTAKGNFFSPRIISAEVKPSSVLKITENDLITATLANSQYVIEEDGTKTTHFDFQTL